MICQELRSRRERFDLEPYRSNQHSEGIADGIVIVDNENGLAISHNQMTIKRGFRVSSLKALVTNLPVREAGEQANGRIRTNALLELQSAGRTVQDKPDRDFISRYRSILSCSMSGLDDRGSGW